MSEREQTIDLIVLLKVLTEHVIPIAIVTVLAAVIGYVLASFIIPKRYTSSALMYVENIADKQADAAMTTSDLSAAQKLVNTCAILFTSDQLMSELSDKLDNKYTASSLKSMTTIDSVNETEVLKLSVVSGDPDDSYTIVNTLLELSTKEFKRVIKNGSIETVSEPTVPKTHSYPSAMRFTIIALLIGFAVSYFFYLIREMLDIKVKHDDDLAQLYNIPVFAEILDFETAGKSSSKSYKYYKYSKYKSYNHYDTSYDSYDSSNNVGKDSVYDDDDDDEDDDDDDIMDEVKVSNA